MQQNDNVKFCGNCGANMNGGYDSAAPAGSPALLGFSSRANDPFFDAYLNKRNRQMRNTGVKIAGILFVVLLILGAMGIGGLTLPIGAGVGGFLAIVALIWSLAYGRKGRKETDYDGTVVNKTIVEKEKKVHETDGKDTWSRKVEYTEYRVHIQCDDGKMRYMADEFESPDFIGFEIGERLRYHWRFHHYEHYDKSRLTHLNCVCCGKENAIQWDYCENCDAPLLK